jgi:cold shock CspA family protein
MVGKIQKYDELRGFGFILQGFRKRIFFHVNHWVCDSPPQAGMAVSYDLIPANKAGFEHQAGNVKPVEVVS